MKPETYILEGTVENFDRLVTENSRRGLVMVDFWAPWAGPSLRQQGILTELAHAYEGRFLLVSINTDEQKPLAQRFGVSSLPGLKLFRHGGIVAEYHGMQPEADYPRIIDAYVTKGLDKASADAVAAWQSGDPERALKILAEAAVNDPYNLALPSLMAKILLRQDRLDEAYELLYALPEQAQADVGISGLLAHLDFLRTTREADSREALQQRIAENPGDAETSYQLAARLLTEGETQAALELLLNLSRQHPGYRNGIARKGMRAVLDKLNPDDPEISRYRRELYRLNY